MIKILSLCKNLNKTLIFNSGDKIYNIFSKKPVNQIVPRRCKQTISDVNTNVKNDIIIFKYENPKFYKMLNLFAICQFGFWNYLGYTAYSTLKDIPVPKNKLDDDQLPWWRKINLGDPKYRYGITFVSFTLGYLILASSWLYTLKSVRYLILRKGGNVASFVTYGPFGKNRIMDVPLKYISSQEARQTARVSIPIKVYGTKMHYVLDMRGEFTNAKLFDYTVGLKRNLNFK